MLGPLADRDQRHPRPARAREILDTTIQSNATAYPDRFARQSKKVHGMTPYGTTEGDEGGLIRLHPRAPLHD